MKKLKTILMTFIIKQLIFLVNGKMFLYLNLQHKKWLVNKTDSWVQHRLILWINKVILDLDKN